MAKDPGQVLLMISGPLSDVWADGKGPARSAIESVLSRNGIDPAGLKATNKQDLVRRGVIAAGPGVPAMELIEDILRLMRSRQLFEIESDSLDYALDNLTRAFRDIGGDLDPVGNVSWPPELEELRQPESSGAVIRRGPPGRSSRGISVSPIPPQIAAPAPSPTVEPREKSALSEKKTIFLVHGNNIDVRNDIETQLHRWKLVPDTEIIVLDRQANMGQTLIEKFEKHAGDAGLAIVVATPDDVGRKKTATDDEPRARQNVIYELGYFNGLLGRASTIVMNAGITQPSDIAGLVYIKYEQGGSWAWELARELKARRFHSPDWLI
ncbi:putative nucleotide-binding protein with TIR-like domain [Geodermatophilus tzadiensis]|uniref:Putative nucleotide-binding protein with TIR-like domain n=1 Tax=Geodermatophilus tzadiensis TaxID=1137988 RepID=A0A2T0T946_9ACTN|nr:nucleotide-binding protein [Geodermatophilus tzadiensis]PRY42166.1 putative nucleotide-binding protein with TIR-like domain [Geodermatophilus tzadiensis]